VTYCGLLNFIFGRNNTNCIWLFAFLIFPDPRYRPHSWTSEGASNSSIGTDQRLPVDKDAGADGVSHAPEAWFRVPSESLRDAARRRPRECLSQPIAHLVWHRRRLDPTQFIVVVVLFRLKHAPEHIPTADTHTYLSSVMSRPGRGQREANPPKF